MLAVIPASNILNTEIAVINVVYELPPNHQHIEFQASPFPIAPLL